MKKLLLGTTAFIAAAAALPAVAADPIKLSVGGYMEDYIGFATNEDDRGTREYRSFDVQTDTEIWFSGSSTLDNGLSLSVMIEMEADGEDNGGTIDTSWLEIASTSLGSLRLGYDVPVTALVHNAAPNYGPSFDDANNWLPESNTSIATDSYVVAGFDKESKVSYFTPRLHGFQASASYIPEMTNRVGSGNGSTSGGMPNGVGGTNANGYAVALTYKETFGGLGVGLDTGYVRANGLNGTDGVRDADGYQIGALLSHGAFEFGGGWQYTNEVHDARAFTGNSAGNEGAVWEVGLGYKPGPWGVSVSYLRSEMTGTLADPDADTQNLIALSGTYAVGPGIDVHGSIYHVDYTDETKLDSEYNDGGWAVVAGFKLAF